MSYARYSVAAWVVLVGAVAFGQTPAKQGESQQAFDSPQAAAEGLFRACRENDTPALVKMFGEKYADSIKSIDPEEEKEHRRALWELSQAYTKVLEKSSDRIEFVVGKDLWAFPIPLVKESRGWVFATDEGLREVLARRIGHNERCGVEVCRTYVTAQLEYAAKDHDGNEVSEYAQRFASTPGKHDGLYWAMRDAGEPLSPMGEWLAISETGGRDSKPRDAYMGYHFKILTRQGSSPPCGKYDYVINGHMIAGFALVAWPAEYRVTGVKTFVINHQGKLFEKDLGPDTAKLAAAMGEYNPDKTWELVKR